MESLIRFYSKPFNGRKTPEDGHHLPVQFLLLTSHLHTTFEPYQSICSFLTTCNSKTPYSHVPFHLQECPPELRIPPTSEKSFLSFKIQLKGLLSGKTFPIPLLTPLPRTITGRPAHFLAVFLEVTVVPSYWGSYISETRLIQIGRDWLPPLFGELYLFNVTSSLFSTNLLFPPAV